MNDNPAVLPAASLFFLVGLLCHPLTNTKPAIVKTPLEITGLFWGGVEDPALGRRKGT